MPSCTCQPNQVCTVCLGERLSFIEPPEDYAYNETGEPPEPHILPIRPEWFTRSPDTHLGPEDGV